MTEVCLAVSMATTWSIWPKAKLAARYFVLKDPSIVCWIKGVHSIVFDMVSVRFFGVAGSFDMVRFLGLDGMFILLAEKSALSFLVLTLDKFS